MFSPLVKILQNQRPFLSASFYFAFFYFIPELLFFSVKRL